MAEAAPSELSKSGEWKRRDQRAQGAGFAGATITLGGVALQVLGLSGIADNVVKWRAFFDQGVMSHYEDFVGYLTGGSASPVASIAVGYGISCLGFFVAAYQTMRQHKRYLERFSNVPDDYIMAEEPIPFEQRGMGKVVDWAQRRSRSAVFRLFLASVVWPAFLLWAIFVWVFAPRRRLAIEMTVAEKEEVERSGFDYAKASRSEALAFLKWSLISLLAFVGMLLVFSDLLIAI